MSSPARLAVLAFVLALPATYALVACTAGDEVAYPTGTTAITNVEGGAIDDSGRVIVDSGISAIPVLGSDGGSIPPPNPSPISCTPAGVDPDGCDPSAGMGCCLPASNTTSDPTQNKCDQQIQFYEGATFCHAASDVFLSCLGSDSDSTCCWQRSPSGGYGTRFRSDCTGGFEACDPNVDSGGSCGSASGGCTHAMCRGVLIGYCGSVSPCP